MKNRLLHLVLLFPFLTELGDVGFGYADGDGYGDGLGYRDGEGDGYGDGYGDGGGFATDGEGEPLKMKE